MRGQFTCGVAPAPLSGWIWWTTRGFGRDTNDITREPTHAERVLMHQIVRGRATNADCAELRRLLATHPIPFQSPAHQPGDAVPPGSSAADRRFSLTLAGGASVSPALFGESV